MTQPTPPGPGDAAGFWMDCPAHRQWLLSEANRQFAFFRASLRPDGGFYTLDHAGLPLPDDLQELHTTTRLVHSYALGHLCGIAGADGIVDHGLRYLHSHHRDPDFGGYLWALDARGVADGRKLAYGHVFVLLAAASAVQAGHPEARNLLNSVNEVLTQRFWDEDAGLFADEWSRDWTPFSTYRGMNANMHGVEALLAAYEATGHELHLLRAGRILAFFTGRVAPQFGWRVPEHYTQSWQVDRDYAGNPMFRPFGTTPGHSFELGRLALQHWDLSGRPANGAPERARKLIERALFDAWDQENGGFAYTLDFDGRVANPARYWWPVTEAIGAIAALITLERRAEDEVWYRRLWSFANRQLIDHGRGGWYPELAADGSLASHQFRGKPDIYHSIQATLFPLHPGLSRHAEALARVTCG